jgi:hypothetical protein
MTKYKRKSFLLERLMEDGTPEGLPGKATVESIGIRSSTSRRGRICPPSFWTRSARTRTACSS